MKRLLIIVFLIIYPISAYSHPGKTDRYGGHKCLKGCKEWGLFHDEYHLHDENWKPIRISKKQEPKPAEYSEPPQKTPKTVIDEKPVEKETVTIYRYVTNIQEENTLLSNPLIFILAVLLLLLLILRMTRKKE